MKKKNAFTRICTVLLMIVFLAVSLMTIAPIQETDAWPFHSNCVTVKKGPNYYESECDPEFHWHITSH